MWVWGVYSDTCRSILLILPLSGQYLSAEKDWKLSLATVTCTWHTVVQTNNISCCALHSIPEATLQSLETGVIMMPVTLQTFMNWVSVATHGYHGKFSCGSKPCFSDLVVHSYSLKDGCNRNRVVLCDVATVVSSFSFCLCSIYLLPSVWIWTVLETVTTLINSLKLNQ